MACALTIAGGVLEVVGLAFVFIELLYIRSFEFGVPTPWARFRGWVRRLLRRPQVVEVGGAASLEAAGRLRAKQRPTPLPAEATDAERITWLTRYVDALDRDMDSLHQRIDTTADELTEAARKLDDQLRAEFDQREEERRRAVRPSLRRQALGSICVFAGIVLGTIGNVI